VNDFTKEELEDLWCYVREFMGNGYDHPRDHKGYALMRKIKTMLNDYCEHEWENTCLECNPLNIYCIKCREYLRGNKI
jgi:hypothetical protein